MNDERAFSVVNELAGLFIQSSEFSMSQSFTQTSLLRAIQHA
jgi:hypothetical protein